MTEQQHNDVSWQWDPAQWSASPQSYSNPLDVPDPDDKDPQHSSALLRLFAWAARRS